MSKLKVPINELRRSIAKNEKALNIQKRGLALLEQAEATLTGGPTAAFVAKKHTQTRSKGATASPEAVPRVSSPAAAAELPPKNRPRPKWSAERRAKTLLSLAKARADKAKAAKKATSKKKAAK
jgi:hypothetical protein